ncbi:MAG: 3'(2'),5'-bisphosphate nucleotidase CysQ family protein [Bacilli bacterium]
MLKTYLEHAYQAALKASGEILAIYQTNFTFENKEDASPVTIADQKADTVIRQYLKPLYPDFGFLTEESSDDFSRLSKAYVWLVDPIDGTKDFIAKNDEFTINIALVHRQQVVVGLIHIPAKKQTYYALKGEGAFFREQGIDTRIYVNDKITNLTVLTSRFHQQPNEVEVIQRYQQLGKITKVETYGSALKACRIAHGFAELSYRLSPGTKEWDTAASDLLVTEAGGFFLKPNQEKYWYNRQDVRNLEGYLILNNLKNFYL